MLLCAFVLVAQLGAASHAVWHAAQKTVPHAQQAVAADRTGTPRAPEIAKLCVFGAAFGQVLGGAPTSKHSFPLQSAVRERIRYDAPRFIAARRLTPQSRGPPVLL